jgi:iron complex transport system substrate-binding protein
MRIASLQPSITLTLHALGRLDSLCAVTKYCLEFLPELAACNLPVLQDSWSFDKPGNLEILQATKPDVVLTSVPYRLESLTAILKSALPVLTLAPHTLADIANDIRLIAALVHATPAAEILLTQIEATLTQTRTLTAASPHQPIVYCEEWGKPLIHSQHWVAELVAIAGGIFYGSPGSHTTAEAIAALPETEQPEVLLFAWCGAGNRVPLERVIQQRNWHHLPAVRNRRVFCIPDEYLNTPAPTILQGLACIASATHPDLFGDHKALIQLGESHPESSALN